MTTRDHVQEAQWHLRLALKQYEENATVLGDRWAALSSAERCATDALKGWRKSQDYSHAKG